MCGGAKLWGVQNILRHQGPRFGGFPFYLDTGVIVPNSSGLSRSGPSDVPTPEPASRTTAWRREREKKMGKSAKPIKTYTCKICGRPMTSDGHTQFFD